ncbi:MAG: hypothetical protein KatS3mg061_2313 [Dehalococcoidia bacterium]|nr:MAG: hypothetical protein KatS3mg061_2313 [Dehalococcoidia bacterium]
MSGGNLAGFDAIVRDITESKQAEEERRQAALALELANLQLSEKVVELESRNQEVAALREMAELLQLCISAEEAHLVVSRFGPRLFSGTSGAVSILKASRTTVDRVAGWGLRSPGEAVFGPNDCWSLRRGRPHLITDPTTGIICPHLQTGELIPSLCVPLVSQGEAFGVLTLVPKDDRPLPEAHVRLAASVAEQVALALANLALRELLRSQSIRDPLTDLYNRRFLEETLERELVRAARSGHPLSLLILDVDHFKRFNDDFGHDAGDALLRELATLLRANVRGSDVACRFGGEEFVVLLPETSEETAAQRAEEIGRLVRELSFSHRGKVLRAVTVSIGVASTASAGTSAQALLTAADSALYQAKRLGRDRVVTASARTSAS